MSLTEIQNKLDVLYAKELDKEKLKKDFEDVACSPSAPFLINVPESYINADIKVIFVGKETSGWWGKLEDFIKYDDSINILKKRYDVELNGGVFLDKYHKPVKERKGEHKWGNSKFLLMYRKLREKFPGLLWNELLKMDSGGEGSSRNSIGIREIEKVSIEIFKKELIVLKPDFIIFATSTGQGYDRVIKEIFENYKTDKNFHIKHNLWKFKSEEYKCICYRTRHPNATNWKCEKPEDRMSIDQYYSKIIEDIKNQTQCCQILILYLFYKIRGV